MKTFYVYYVYIYMYTINAYLKEEHLRNSLLFCYDLFFDLHSFSVWTINGGDTFYQRYAEINLCMRPANERRRYIATSYLIGSAHTQNYSWVWRKMADNLWLHSDIPNLGLNYPYIMVVADLNI